MKPDPYASPECLALIAAGFLPQPPLAGRARFRTPDGRGPFALHVCCEMLAEMQAAKESSDVRD